MYQNLIKFNSLPLLNVGPILFSLTKMQPRYFIACVREDNAALLLPNTKKTLLLSLHNLPEPREFLQSHAGAAEVVPKPSHQVFSLLQAGGSFTHNI